MAHSAHLVLHVRPPPTLILWQWGLYASSRFGGLDKKAISEANYGVQRRDLGFLKIWFKRSCTSGRPGLMDAFILLVFTSASLGGEETCVPSCRRAQIPTSWATTWAGSVCHGSPAEAHIYTPVSRSMSFQLLSRYPVITNPILIRHSQYPCSIACCTQSTSETCHAPGRSKARTRPAALGVAKARGVVWPLLGHLLL